MYFRKHAWLFVFYIFRNDIEDLEKLSSTDVQCWWKERKYTSKEKYKSEPIHLYPCLNVEIEKKRKFAPMNSELILKEIQSVLPN